MTLSRRHFQLIVPKLVEDNWGTLEGFSSVKDVDMVQSVLKSFFNYLNSIYSYY